LALSILAPAIIIKNNVALTKVLVIGPLLSWTGLLINATFVVGWLIVDITSFVQTAMFMRLARTAHTLRDMIAIAIFDIILTLNIFTFVFSAIYAIGVEIADHNGISGTFSIHPFVGPSEDDQKKFDSFTGYGDALWTLSKSGVATQAAIIVPRGSNGEIPYPGYTIIFTKELSPEEFVNHLLQSIPDAQIFDDRRTVLGEKSYSGKAFKIHMAGAFRHVSIFESYVRAYYSSNLSQSEFLSLVKLRYVPWSLGRYFEYPFPRGTLEPHPTINLFFVHCDGREYFTRSIDDLNKCTSLGMLPIGWALVESYMALQHDRMYLWSGPASIYASTSLFLTMAFYTGIVVIALLWLVRRVIRPFIFSNRFLDMSVAPLTVGCVYLLVLTSPVVLLVIGVGYSLLMFS
jgi:hypothetical protein